MTGRRALATLAVIVLSTGCAGDRSSEGTGAATFNRDVAPPLFKHCSSCHRPEGAAPFALLTYADARKRVRQIARVTRSRFMPPWLPEPGHGEFARTRRLTDDEIAVFRDWSEGKAIEGATSDLPPAPDWPEGWQLGEPDLVVEMPQPYTLYAEGIDVYRNFVIPAPVTGEHWILVDGAVPAQVRTNLITFMNRANFVSVNFNSMSRFNQRQKIRGLVHLIMSLPEYHMN